MALACLVGGMATLRPVTLIAYDQPLYLGIASDLLQTGVYTNGRRGDGTPGAYTAPLYPATVAGLAALDRRLAEAAACVRAAMPALPAPPSIAFCPTDLGILLPVQTALGVATLLLVFASTLCVGGGRAAAWCALLAAGLGTTELAAYTRTAMTEALSLPLSALAGLLLIRLVRRPHGGAAVSLGVVLGLLTLTRPEYLYLAAAIGITGGGWALWQRRRGAPLVAAALVCALVISPWSLRNHRLFGTWQPTYGYAGFILAQRMAYEAMTPAEWTAQWLYALPGFGPAAARMLFHHDVDRLGWEDRPDTFYMVGNTTLQQEMLQAAPAPADQVGYLLGRFVWPHPLRFAAISAVMAWKTLWVRKYFSVVAMPFLAAFAWRAIRRRDAARLAFLLPPVLIVALHGLTSVGTPRYSLMMIPLYAASFGLVIGPLIGPMIGRMIGRAFARIPGSAMEATHD